jgi:hypothetical protein
MDIRNNIFSNRATGGNPTPYNTVFTCVYVPSITAISLTMNNNAYFQGTTAYSGIGQVTATGSAANLYLAGNFNPSVNTPASNWRSVTTAMGLSTNDNASYGLSLAPPFVSATDFHIPNGTATPLESTGAAGLVGTDIDAQVRNPATPDMGADEFTGIFADIIPPSISYSPLAGTLCVASRQLSATITDLGGINVAAGTKPRIWFKKSTNANVLPATNTNTTDGWKYTEASNAISPFDFTIDYSLIFGGVAAGENIQYFVIAQDLATTPNVTINSGTATGTPASVALSAGNFPITGTINNYTIGSGGLGGAVTIGAGGTYTSLTGAGGLFAALNSSGLTANMTATILDASVTETGANALNQVNYGCAGSYTLTILPGPGVNATLTGSLASSALIRILSNNVIIDGSNNGSTSRNLTITNTSITTPSVVLIGSVGTVPRANVTMKNAIVINGVNTSSAVAISDATTLGNAGYFNNITIQNNSIQKAYIGLFCNAAVVPGNGNVNIVSNDVTASGANAIRICGLYVQGTDGATISQNMVGNFETTSAENDVAIWMATGAGNTTVSGNIVSNLAYTGTGAQAPFGIRESSGLAASGNNITGNTVTNITTSGSATVYGIENSGGGTIIQKNMVTTIKNTNTGTFAAFGINVSAGNNVIIRNNFVSDVNHDMTGGAAFSTTFGVFGIRIATGTGHKVYHNSVNLYGLMPGTATTSLLSAAFALVSTASTGCDVRNNIFANTITGGTTSIAHVSVALPSGGTAAMNLTWNNNAYYFGTDAARQGVGQAGVTAGTNFYTTLAALTAYTGTLGNATNDNRSSANTSAAPFVSATDLHIDLLAASCNISNAGAALGVADDIDGDTRNALTPDIGADEFASTSEPTITLGSNPAVCAGNTTANLTYSATTNTPDQYSIDFNPAAEAQGFVDVTNVALPGTPIVITVPGAAPTGVYNATLTVRNSTTGCASISYAITLSINPNNTVTLTSPAGTDAQTVCFNTPITNITYSTTGATGANFSGLPAGVNGNWAANVVTISGAPTASGTFNYTVTLTGGCGVTTANGSIIVNPPPTISSTITQPATCVSTDGAIDITIGGAAGPYTYAWSTVGGSGLVNGVEDQTGLTIGQYTVIVTAANGCQATAVFSLVGPGSCSICPAIGTVTTTPSGAACANSTVTLTASGLTFMGVTYGITFKYSTVALADPYVGGTVIATVPNGSLTGGGTVATTTTNFPVAANYIIYAILSPVPVDPSCRPAAQAALTVNPIPTVTATPASQTKCSGAAITTIVLSGSAVPGTVYDWTRDNTVAVTGIAANGSGNISGTLTNTTSAPVTVTFTIIPTANGCPGSPVTATVLVNPTPNAVATPASQTVCSGTPITTIALTGSVSGTTYTWTRNNTVAVTGITASGSGNISGTLTNTTNAPVTVTFTITPSANGCPGAPITATVLVNPTPVISQGGMQVIITGDGSWADEITWTLTNSLGTVVLSGGPYGFSPPPTPSATVPATNAPFTFFISAQGVINDNSCLWEVRCDGNIVASGCIRATGNPGSCPNVGTLTVNNISGCGSNLSPQTICSGSAITPIVFGGTIPGTVFNWTRNNTVAVTGIAASGSGNISGTLTNTTNAPVVVAFTITPTANGCNGTPVVVNITVNPTPNAVATPAAQTICTGTAITPIVLTSAVTGTTYSWTRNNTVAVTGIAANGTGNISGTLTNTTAAPVTVTFTIIPTANGCPGTPITATVTVNQTLTITCPANITAPSVVGGCTAVVTYAPVVVGTPAPVLTYVLSGATTGSGNGSGSGSAFNVGVTTVTLTATNSCGLATCSFTVTITDSQLPVISTQPVNRTVCAGSSATFTVVATNVLSYQWQQWNGSAWVNTGTNAASLTLNNVGVSQNTNTYRVILNGLCTVVTSNAASLYVNTLPAITLATSRIPILLPTETVTITATTIPSGGSYTWFRNGVAVPGVTGPVLANLTVDDAGTYRVVYTDPNGCTSTSVNIEVSAAVSSELLVYPNPNDGRFQVRFYNQVNEEVTLSVYDAKGARVYHKSAGTLNPYTAIDVDISGRPAGIYIVEVRNSAGQQVGSKRIILGH